MSAIGLEVNVKWEELTKEQRIWVRIVLHQRVEVEKSYSNNPTARKERQKRAARVVAIEAALERLEV